MDYRPTTQRIPMTDAGKGAPLQKQMEGDRWVSLRSLRAQPHQTSHFAESPAPAPQAPQLPFQGNMLSKTLLDTQNSLYHSVLRRHREVKDRLEGGLPPPPAQEQRKATTTAVHTPQTIAISQARSQLQSAATPAPAGPAPEAQGE